MSLKRKMYYHINNLKNFWFNFALPNWLNSSFFKFALTTCIFVFTIGYVYQISSIATSGYKIHDLEVQIKELKREIQKIEVENADFGTMKNIQTRLDSLNMVAVVDIEYYNNLDSMVAKR